MRKQFDIKYRPQIESGEYKVELRDGRPAKIIYWDAKGPSPIVCLYMTDDGSETTAEVRPDGRWSDDPNCEMYDDLFIVTPEEELTEWEKAVGRALTGAQTIGIIDEFIKEKAAELLSLARKQLQPEIDAEIEKAYKNADEVMYRKGKEDGIAEARNDISARIIALKQAKDRAEEALKKLQRCEDKESSIKTGDRVLIHCKSTRDEDIKHIYDNQEGKVLHIWDLKRNPWGNIHVKIEGGYNNGFLLEELEKLPGFKEDEK